MPVKGGPPVQLTATGGAHPIESIDGKTLYYRSDRDAKEIRSIPVDGGRPVKVAGPTHGWPFSYAVTAEGLFYPAPPHSGEQRFVRFVNFKTGENNPVVVASQPFLLGMSVSPDGRYLLFDQLHEMADLMIIRNFRAP